MSNSLPEYKRRALENQRAALLEEYEAANAQLSRELADVNRKRVQRQIADLEQQIAEIDAQLEGVPANLPVFKGEKSPARDSVQRDPMQVDPERLAPAGVDFVLVTALREELDAVLAQLPGYSQLPPAHDDIRTYYQTALPATFPDGSTGQYRLIVLSLLGMGRVQAAAATSDAIRKWHPRYLMLIGIAGGIAARKVQIGDILISEQIVDYELQKLTPQGPEVRWEVHRADARLLSACKNFRSADWQQQITVKRPRKGEPHLHFGPIASGDKVIAFGEVLARYRDVWPKLLGVEMEAAGAATAAFQSAEAPGFFMVRSVSDLADEAKGSPNVEKWRAYACEAAAAFAIALLSGGPVPLSETGRSEQNDTPVRMPVPQSPANPPGPEAAALQMARRSLAHLERQAGAYTASTIPAHLQIDLEEKRKQVEELEARWRAGKL